MSKTYDNAYDADFSRIAIQYLMDERAISRSRMADMMNKDQKFTIKMTNGSIAKFLDHGTGVSVEKVFLIAKLLGADSWSDLYAKGDQAVKENPFHAKWVQDSFKILMKEEKLSITELANRTNGKQVHLEKFLSTGEYTSMLYLLEVAKGLGAESWGDLYRKAGVPAQSVQLNDHDLAVSGIVESLQNLPVSGTVGEIMNKPIKQVLEERDHQGPIRGGVKEMHI